MLDSSVYVSPWYLVGVRHPGDVPAYLLRVGSAERAAPGPRAYPVRDGEPSYGAGNPGLPRNEVAPLVYIEPIKAN